MCKEHFDAALGILATIGNSLPACVEFVGLVRDPERGKETLLSTVTLDETVDRCKRALALAEALQAQAHFGVLQAGETPPTAH